LGNGYIQEHIVRSGKKYIYLINAMAKISKLINVEKEDKEWY